MILHCHFLQQFFYAENIFDIFYSLKVMNKPVSN